MESPKSQQYRSNPHSAVPTQKHIGFDVNKKKVKNHFPSSDLKAQKNYFDMIIYIC